MSRRWERHVPIGRLGDGAALYAPVGSVKAVDAGQKVVCHACGELLSHIADDHVRRHGLSVAQYKHRFGLAPRASLVAPAAAAVKADLGRVKYWSNAGVKDGLTAGRAHTASAAEATRRERVLQLGFADLTDYMRDRYDGQGWGLNRIARELGTSHRVVRGLLEAAGIRVRAPAIRARPDEQAAPL